MLTYNDCVPSQTSRNNFLHWSTYRNFLFSLFLPFLGNYQAFLCTLKIKFLSIPTNKFSHFVVFYKTSSTNILHWFQTFGILFLVKKSLFSPFFGYFDLFLHTKIEISQNSYEQIGLFCSMIQITSRTKFLHCFQTFGILFLVKKSLFRHFLAILAFFAN